MFTNLEVCGTKHTSRFMQVTGLVNLLQIIRLAEVCFPNLSQHRFAQVQELILLKVFGGISLVGMKVLIGFPVYYIVSKDM